MRLVKYITESFDKLDSIKSNLSKDCRPFLDDLSKNVKRGHYLYRGTSKLTQSIIELKPRLDRKPSDMPIEVHYMLDDAFWSKFKWKPRSEGVFCSFVWNVAKGYGTPFMLFPKGEYKILWSKEIDDLFSYVKNSILYNYEEEFGLSDMYYYEEEYNETYSENGEGEWYYDGKTTGKNQKEDALGIVLKWEGKNIDKEENPWNYVNQFKLKWIPDVEWEDFIEDKRKNIEIEAENEIDTIINSYKEGDIGGADKHKNEIMLKCKSYYLVHMKYEKDLKNFIWNDYKKK